MVRENTVMIAKFVNTLIEYEILDEPNKENYIYALTLRLEQIITFGFLLMIAIMLHKVFFGMVYSLAFVLLRKATGGFHARTFIRCLAGTSTLFFLMLQIIVPFLASHMEISSLLLLLSIVCIYRYAPVNHPNLMLTVEEENNHRRWSRIILFMELLFVCFGIFLKMKWQQYIISGIILCAVFIVIAKIIGQEVTENEKG